MFTEVADGVVASSEGYFVNNHGHFVVIYMENFHIARFECEPGAKAYIYSLDKPVKWDPPYDHQTITLEKQNQIKDRVQAAVLSRGYGGEFVRE